MSSGDFDRALSVILEEEGGWYDGSQPWDPNPTMHGITQVRYDQYRANAGLEAQSVQLISDNERDTIYLTDYWQPSHAALLPWPLSLFHFDFYVNTTPVRAIRALQRALHVPADGVWGPQTEAATVTAGVGGMDAVRLIVERLLEYEDIVKHDPVKATPLVKEWIPRVADLYRRYL
jgi:lysozyme family protein